MVVITDISVPAEQFALGRLLEVYPDIDIELEAVVPLQSAIIPLFWVEGADSEDVEETFHDDSIVDDVNLLTETEGRFLFEIKWDSSVNSLLGALAASEAEVMSAEGEVDEWEFRLQFTDRDHLATFRRACVENDVDIQLRRLYNPSLPPSEGPLTQEQYDVLATGFENGYWEVPRAITLGELAELIGISDNAASQRLRRAINTVLSDTLYPKEDLID